MSSKITRHNEGHEGEQSAKSEKKPKLWKGIKPRVAIMRGSLAQSDVRFGHGSRNKQGPPNVIAAICYADVKNPKEWTSADVDLILRAGDELYRVTTTQMKIKGGTTFSPSCTYPTLYVAFYKFNIFIGSDVITGELNAQPEVEEVFKKNLHDVLQENNGVIIRLGENYFSLWKTDKFYYWFCPHPGDKKGQTFEITHGTAFTLRSVDFSTVVEYFLDIHSGPYSLYSLKILRKAKIETSIAKILATPQQPQPEEAPQEEAPPEVEPKEAKEEKIKGKPKADVNDAKATKDAKTVKPLSAADPRKMREEIDVPELKEPPTPEPTFSNDYREIPPDRGILLANTYVKEPERILHTNVAAAIYLSMFRSNMWTKDTMTDILKLGKAIFEASSDEGLTENENWQERIIFPIEYAKKFYKVQFEKIIFGEVVPRDNSVICEFKQGVTDFFHRFDIGLVNGPQTVLLWQEAGIYYMFDAKERDGMGRKWTRLLSSGLGDMKNSGGACVTWYRHIKDLADVYVANVQLKHRRDAYRIVKVEILEDTGKEEDFNEWKALDHNKWRILGKINLCEKSHDEDMSRDSKAMCIAVVAAIFNKIRPLEEWTPATVDEILDVGIELYKQSFSLEEEEEEESSEKFGYGNIVKIAAILDQRVQLLVEECVIGGRILVLDSEEDIDLGKGLAKFFQHYETGILSIREFLIAIWYFDKFYYLYYPYEKTYGRNEACICKEYDPEVFGYAFVLRFKDVPSMTKELLNIFSINQNDEFCIANIFATMFKADEKPPLHNYSDFTENGAMLRPFKDDYHEGHESFFIRADKQTLANVLVALGLAHINRAALWNKEDIVDILRIGDKIFCNVTNQLKDCGVKEFELSWDHIKLVIGSNNFTVTRNEGKGIFKHPPPQEEEGMMYMMDEEGEEVSVHTEEGEEVLPEELQKVLAPWEKEEKAFGVLDSVFYKAAIWKQDDLYFIFDPKANSETGYPSQRRIEKAVDAIKERKKKEGGEEEEEEETVEEEQRKIEEPSKKDYNEISNDGAAYVAWFYKFDAFIEHLLSKVPEQYHQEKFTIDFITLASTWSPTSDPTGQNRHNFHYVPEGHTIMRATMSQNELMFPNRTKQEASNAIVALAFALISTCDRWNSTILDIILKYGDRLYTKSFNLLKQEDPETACLSEKLLVEHMAPTFSIYKIKFEFRVVSKSSGVVNMNDFKELKKAIGKLGTIEGNIGAAIRLKGILNTMWRSGNSIYLFDPNETDPSGFVAKTGFASLSKFTSLTSFYEFLSKKFGCLPGVNTFEAYIIEISHALPSGMPTSGINTLGKMELMSKLTENETMFVPIENGMRLLTGFMPEHKVPVILLCLATIIHSRLHYVEVWIDNVVEQIYFLGQYLLGKAKCELDKIKDVIKVDLEEMIPNFTIDNILVHVNINNVMQGPLGPNPDANNIYLKNALQIYFRECTHAIVTINSVSFALWKEAGIFYLFQDNSKINKRATITTSPLLENMYEIMIKNFDVTDKSSWYDIKNCKVTTIPIKETCRPQKKALVEGCEEANEDRLCARKVPSDIRAYCGECNYWDYITKKPRKSKLRKPKVNKDYKSVSDNIDVLSGKMLLERMQFYNDESKYRPSLTASCLVAAAMNLIKKPEDWTSKTIDLIVNCGVILYMDTVAVKGSLSLEITDFENIFYMSNHRFHVTACEPAQFLIGDNMRSILIEVSKQHNTLYFMAHKSGDEKGWLYLVLIFEKCYSYIFFPGGIGHCIGDLKPVKETACLLRFKEMDDLVSQLLTVTKNLVPVMSIGPILACIK